MQRKGCSIVRKRNLKKIIELRHLLHRNPELSMQEKNTLLTVRRFLEDNTELRVTDMGSWLYAVKAITLVPGTMRQTLWITNIMRSDEFVRHLHGIILAIWIQWMYHEDVRILSDIRMATLWKQLRPVASKSACLTPTCLIRRGYYVE